MARISHFGVSVASAPLWELEVGGRLKRCVACVDSTDEEMGWFEW